MDADVLSAATGQGAEASGRHPLPDRLWRAARDARRLGYGQIAHRRLLLRPLPGELLADDVADDRRELVESDVDQPRAHPRLTSSVAWAHSPPRLRSSIGMPWARASSASRTMPSEIPRST